MKKYFRSGEIFIWFTGMGLGLSLIMITGLLFLIVVNGKDYFWASELVQITRTDGSKQLGEIVKEEPIPNLNLPDSLWNKGLMRMQMKIGNRDLYGFDFQWIDEREIKNTDLPKFASTIERIEFGNFYGFVKEILVDGDVKVKGEEEIAKKIGSYLDITSSIRNEIKDIEKSKIGKINYNIESLRLEIKKIEFRDKNSVKNKNEIARLESEIAKENRKYEMLKMKVDSLNLLASRYAVYCEDANGRGKTIPMINIVRVYQPNNMSFLEKLGFTLTKIREFIFDDPRESNTEGGVFPAIFGTVMMVLLMSIFTVPFGVLAALYLREYAKQGPLVRTVRIAVNNLAGVPSIVFGVFGLGFFIYFIGGTIDQLFFPERLPSPTWGTGGILWASLTLALLTMPVVIVATEEALTQIPRGMREAALALGATKWQVVRRVILPAATPGILTGLILAMARAAGEVAPLMITGVVKLAPSLPFDSYFPFFHLDRKFMHLGFHIYDVGFQSPNIEAAMPMVYTTTLLLILIVVLLNITAMIIRANLRKKYKSATF
ncbi:Phosphate transport system permease protein [Ignavibacterium album JCM 16511]|uniref:Phosphate transport system permease protein PstA n=1 Tax=Ignavibacterium album (strain DSM 19864 / JCM 16511 / NBRC 101810 / Mat9-16) TaxID=945713 RepID=I0AKU9_IGNAJ|nr:phosphate ABC transporter permease PstA [Ignavibacterium album]AFH49606.1 Phosphate transport system permease protein [Ignavibacterium album JCM 16511]